MNHSKDNYDYDKNSINSDVSANTDLKVFHGAINGNTYLPDLNSKIVFQHNKILNNENKNSNLNEKFNDKFNLDDSNNKKKEKNVNSNIKALHGNIFNLFSQNKNNENEKYNINNNNLVNNLNDNKEHNSELLSFRNETDIIDHTVNTNINIKNNLKKEEMKLQLLQKFKDVTFEDKEVINQGYVKIFEAENKKSTNSYRTMTNSQSIFKVSTIEKGIALLVNSEDCIFTLPTFLLPKNIKIGNNYTFFIQEINKNMQDKHKIALSQKSYLKNYSEK